MKELKCPKCGNAFTVDEADYAFILQQVKTSEFNAEVEKRLAELRAGEAAQRELALADKDAEIANLKAEGLTIRKLTRGNPTMKAMFAAVADKSVDEQEVAGGEETV